jgi:hypothetical protein
MSSFRHVPGPGPGSMAGAGVVALLRVGGRDCRCRVPERWQPPRTCSLRVGCHAPAPARAFELPSDEDDSENRPMLKSGSGPSQGCMKSCLSSTQTMRNARNNGVKRLLGWKREPSYQARSISLSGGVKTKTYLSTSRKADPALLQAAQALTISHALRKVSCCHIHIPGKFSSSGI